MLAASIYLLQGKDEPEPRFVVRSVTLFYKLSPEERETFKRSIDGSTYNRELSCWTLRRDQLLVAVHRLEAAGVQVLPHKLVLPYLQAEDESAVARVDEANQSIEELEVKLAERGFFMFGFQKNDVRFMASRNRMINANEQGLGKTIETLCALPYGAAVLVTCPLEAKPGWARECAEWRDDFVPIVIEKKSQFRLPAAHELIIVNYDIIPIANAKTKIPAPLTLIADEVHKLKSTGANRSAAVKSYSIRADRAFALTGTPLPNDPKELWNILAVFGLEREVFGNKQRLIDLFHGRMTYYYTSEPCKNCEGAGFHWNPRFDQTARVSDQFYQTLEVSRNASLDTVKASFRKLVKLHHPDVNRDDPTAHERFSLINTAYQAISKRLETPSDEPETFPCSHCTGGTKRVPHPSKMVWGVCPTNILYEPDWRGRMARAPDWKPNPLGCETAFKHAADGRKGCPVCHGEPMPPSPEIAELLKRVMIRHEKKDVLKDLPDKIYKVISVPLDKKLLREIDDSIEPEVRTAVLEAEDLDQIKNIHAGLVRGRMILAQAKIKFAEQLLDEWEAENIVSIVFSSHRSPIERFGKRAGWACIMGGLDVDRGQIQKDFQAGKYRGLAATIGAASTALTLTKATRELFIDRSWVPADNDQAEDRAHRIGQTVGLVIFDLIADHPIDKHVHLLNHRKRGIIKATIGKVKGDRDVHLPLIKAMQKAGNK